MTLSGQDQKPSFDCFVYIYFGELYHNTGKFTF
nr:MAG TPA: hypothetical protein [Caudoviricetes sp.]DAI03991.1 MAG TPA: hypothetical protein [Caudoviricetes sp.]